MNTTSVPGAAVPGLPVRYLKATVAAPLRLTRPAQLKPETPLKPAGLIGPLHLLSRLK